MLTGKGLNWGGSLVRPEATGYGAVYFAQNMLAERGQSLEGKVCTVSGSGNVSIYTVEKLYQVGAKPVTVSDSNGMIYDERGIDLAILKQVKELERARLTRYVELRPGAVYTPVETGFGQQAGIFFIPQQDAIARPAEAQLVDFGMILGEIERLAHSMQVLQCVHKIHRHPAIHSSLWVVAQSADHLHQRQLQPPIAREQVIADVWP